MSDEVNDEDNIKLLYNIEDWIGHVGRPVRRKEILEHFGLDKKTWKYILVKIEESQTTDDSYVNIKIHGTKKGRKYFLEGMESCFELVSDEEIAEQMYQALCDSGHELRWSEIAEAIGLAPQVAARRSSNIQRALKMAYPDVIKGSKRGLWTIGEDVGDDTHPDISQALGLEILAEVKRLKKVIDIMSCRMNDGVWKEQEGEEE